MATVTKKAGEIVQAPGAQEQNRGGPDWGSRELELPKWGIASIEQDVARHRSLRNKWHASVRLASEVSLLPVLLRLFDRAV